VTSQAAALTTLDHAPANHARGGISNPILGMLLFICSEVMFFSGLFAAYFSVRASAVHWPPVTPQVPEALADHFNLHAEPWYALGLTLILVTSSFTCQFAVWAIRRDDRTGFIRNIGVTLVLGIVFLLGQGLGDLRRRRRPMRRRGADAEVGREQPREEHDLGADEQDHPEDRVADPAPGVVGEARHRVVLGHRVARIAGRDRAAAGCHQ
jgi:hypothetical protein